MSDLVRRKDVLAAVIGGGEFAFIPADKIRAIPSVDALEMTPDEIAALRAENDTLRGIIERMAEESNRPITSATTRYDVTLEGRTVTIFNRRAALSKDARTDGREGANP